MRRILVLAPRFPFPLIRGDKLRIYNLCRGLARDHELTLLTLCETREELRARIQPGVFAEVHRVLLPRWRSKLQALGALLGREPLQVAYYRSREFRRMVRSLAPKHDVVLAHLIRTAQYVEGIHHIPRVLEMTDALSRTYLRGREVSGLGLMRHVYALEAGRVRRYEQRLINRFDLVSLVSPIDRTFLLDRQIGTAHHVRVFTIGVDLSRRWVGSSDAPCVAFVGHMRSTPNIDACNFFIEEVLPLIRSSAPEMRFRIVGSASPQVLERFRSYEGVEATGEVEEIASKIGDVCCAVAPMRIGAGVQNKVLDYMSLGLPAVVTTVALEGIRAQAGRHLLVGRNPEEFATHVLSLYRDADLRTTLSLRARNIVEREHSWPSVWQRFGQAVSSLGDGLESGKDVGSPSEQVGTQIEAELLDMPSTVSR